MSLSNEPDNASPNPENQTQPAPVASPALTQPLDPPTSARVVEEESEPRWRTLIAPAWFLLGILVGLAAFAAYTQITKPPAPAAVQTLDEATVRKAARDGLIEAIQALQQQSQQQQQQGQASQAPQPIDKNAVTVRAANRLGNENAKVTIVEFADFQCPFCGRHHQLVEPALIQDYVNTGKANLVYKHLAFLGQESVDAAVASECAADQGKFWEYHNYLFEHQNGENQGAFTKDKLIEFGKTLGLDMNTFQPCVQGDKTLDRVKADTMEGQKFGVSSTPTFFINGQPLVGLASADEFKKVVDAALNQ